MLDVLKARLSELLKAKKLGEWADPYSPTYTNGYEKARNEEIDFLTQAIQKEEDKNKSLTTLHIQIKHPCQIHPSEIVKTIGGILDDKLDAQYANVQSIEVYDWRDGTPE